MKLLDIISKIKAAFCGTTRFDSEDLYDDCLWQRNKHKAEFEKLFADLSPVEKQEFEYLNAMNEQPKTVRINKHYYMYKTFNEVLHKIEASEVSK